MPDQPSPVPWGRRFTIWGTSISGMLLAAYFTSHDWLHHDGWWLTWLGFAIYFLVISLNRPNSAAGWGFLFGLLFMGRSFWWAEDMLAYSMNSEGIAPRCVFIGLVIWEAIPFAAIGFLLARGRLRNPNGVGLLVPICVAVLFGSLWPRVFIWEIGHTQLAYLPFAQIADLGGGPLLTWFVLWTASLPLLVKDAYFAIHPERRALAKKVSIAVLAGVVAVFTYGQWRLARWNERLSGLPTYAIGCVQDNPADWTSIARMRAASDAIKEPIDLLCWPESTLGTHSQSLKSLSDSLQVTEHSLLPAVDSSGVVGLKVPLIVGGKTFSEAKREDVPVRQTAFLISPQGDVLAHYHKRGLMPLGEYVPYESSFPWLHDWFQLGEYFIPGESDDPIETPDGTKVGVLVCYEDISPSLVRRTCMAGAEILVCIINASAFERSIALEQHMRLAQLRTIENRRFLVRVSGTGISCTIRPTGEKTQALQPNVAATFVAKPNQIKTTTFYTQYGNWVAWTAGILIANHFLRRV